MLGSRGLRARAMTRKNRVVRSRDLARVRSALHDEGMEPPSTSSPVALRGRQLDQALCDAEPSRKPWSGREPTPSPRDDRRMAFAEAFAREEKQAPRSDGPLTM